MSILYAFGQLNPNLHAPVVQLNSYCKEKSVQLLLVSLRDTMVITQWVGSRVNKSYKFPIPQHAHLKPMVPLHNALIWALPSLRNSFPIHYHCSCIIEFLVYQVSQKSRSREDDNPLKYDPCTSC